MNKLEFSSQIHLSIEYLERLARRSRYLYRAFQIKKHNGTDRLIESPNQELKGIQNWILINILENIPLSESVHGFRKAHSIRTNAMPHLGKRYAIGFDIKDFFPSIKLSDVTHIFKDKASCDLELSMMLSSLCTYENHLPQGGVCSPCLANLAFSNLDTNIEQLCSEKRISYTRYAGDITISSNDNSRLMQVYNSVIIEINRSKFRINESKTRFISKKNRMEVTGIIINSPKLSIGRELKKTLRSQLHNYYINGNHENENKIIGMLSFLHDIEPDTYNSFKAYIKKIQLKEQKKT